jgi:hypothetical protein
MTKKALYQVHGPSLESRDSQRKDRGIEESPAGIAQVDDVLGVIVLNTNVLEDPCQEVSDIH